jgi:hypothetical protein
MLTPILIATLSLTGSLSEFPLGALGRHRSPFAPSIEVWTNRDDVLRRGDKVKLYFRTDVDAYVTVFRIDTDGRVRVLFPSDPYDDNYARGGDSYRVDPRDDGYTFRVDDYPGQGYLFAVATLDPFVYTALVRADHWDYRLIGANGRVVGDPYAAAGDLIASIVPAHYADYTYDIVPYYVEERYEYPRFLCYDCHAYASYPYWDPYAHSCFKFRIVIYDDPYYYPARVYGGTRVVYRRPTTLVPRYVFKDRGSRDEYVTTVRERPVDDAGRRRVEPGATRRVLPGGVQVPTPSARPPARTDVTPRRLAEPSGQTGERRASPATPTLERRDPARLQATPERKNDEPDRAAVQRTEPERRAEPDRRAEPARPVPEADRPEPRRVEPSRQPEARPAPQGRAAPSTPPSRRAEPPRSSTPPRAEPRRSEPPRKVTPPKRRN